MSNIVQLYDASNNEVYPVTHLRAVRDSSGTTLESMMQDVREIAVGYYECSTPGSTAAKTITIDSSVSLSTKILCKVKFVEKNTVNNATMNINGTGAKALYYNGVRAAANNSWYPNEVVDLYYDGTNYQAKSCADTLEYDVSLHQTHEITEITTTTRTLVFNGNVVSSWESETPVSDSSVEGYTRSETNTGQNVDSTTVDGPNATYDSTANKTNVVYVTTHTYTHVVNNYTFSEAVNAVPMSYRHGGLKLRFISNSDDNKYVQYRLMSNSFSTTESNWQGIDDEPTAGSGNLVKSGGVYAEIKYKRLIVNYGFEIGTISNGNYISGTDYIRTPEKITIPNNTVSLTISFVNYPYNFANAAIYLYKNDEFVKSISNITDSYKIVKDDSFDSYAVRLYYASVTSDDVSNVKINTSYVQLKEALIEDSLEEIQNKIDAIDKSADDNEKRIEVVENKVNYRKYVSAYRFVIGGISNGVFYNTTDYIRTDIISLLNGTKSVEVTIDGYHNSYSNAAAYLYKEGEYIGKIIAVSASFSFDVDETFDSFAIRLEYTSVTDEQLATVKLTTNCTIPIDFSEFITDKQIVNNLLDGGEKNALSAEQGKVIGSYFLDGNKINNKINCNENESSGYQHNININIPLGKTFYVLYTTENASLRGTAIIAYYDDDTSEHIQEVVNIGTKYTFIAKKNIVKISVYQQLSYLTGKAGTTNLLVAIIGMSSALSNLLESNTILSDEVASMENFINNVSNKVSTLENKNVTLKSEWIEFARSIQKSRKNAFLMLVQTDTHVDYYNESLTNGYRANNDYSANCMRLLASYTQANAMANLGDIIRGYEFDPQAETRKSADEIMLRYTYPISCPTFLVLGNHDNGYLYYNAKKDDSSVSADDKDQLSLSEVYGRYMNATKRTGDFVFDGKSFYYYKDYDDIRVIVLNSQDNDESTSWDFGFSAKQIAWFKNVALNTSKHVVVMCHVPLLASLSNDTPESAENIINELVTFKNNGGVIIGCFSGHTHRQDYANDNGINYVVFQNGSEICESVMIDTDTRTVTTKCIGSTTLNDRNWTY